MPGTAETHGAGEWICWKCGKHFRTNESVCPDDGSRLIAVSAGDLADPLVGTLFDGRFRVYKKLGEGGMGNVYSARQIDFERDVALKILKADFLRDENIRTRFMYEARTISKLRHPNALRLFDFGQAPDGSFYMVMELLEGESLADRLAYAFVSFRDVFNIVPPVCGVLFEAHENHVIHRDLKPENIYLVNVNQREEFTKLLDFGIAKHLQDRTMTSAGTLWGTPAYMSPEQAKGETVGAPADIYAIGIILFELISGNLPFASETQMGLAMKHINVNARSLRSIPGLAEVVPDELDDLVMECLAKDPAARPLHCEVVAERLNAIKLKYFDETRLAIVPAEEVDAIALQDWIAAEPDVSDEAPIPGFSRGTSSMTPLPTASDFEAARAGLRTTGTFTDDELQAIGVEKRNRGIGFGLVALGMLVIGLVVGFAVLGRGGDEAVVPEASASTAEVRESAAGSAGASASSAANVVMLARKISEAIDREDSLAADIAAEVVREPTKAQAIKPKKSGLEAVKPAIERTF